MTTRREIERERGEWKGDLLDDCSLRARGYLAHVERMSRTHWWAAVSWSDPLCATMRRAKSWPPRKGTRHARHANGECACGEINASEIGLFWPGGNAGGLAARRWCEWVIYKGVADLIRAKEKRR